MQDLNLRPPGPKPGALPDCANLRHNKIVGGFCCQAPPGSEMAKLPFSCLRNYRLQLRVCCAYGGFRTSSPLTYSAPVDPYSPPSKAQIPKLHLDNRLRTFLIKGSARLLLRPCSNFFGSLDLCLWWRRRELHSGPAYLLARFIELLIYSTFSLISQQSQTHIQTVDNLSDSMDQVFL
jgi:hypothetical protein